VVGTTQHEVKVALHPDCDLEKGRNKKVLCSMELSVCFMGFPIRLFWGKEHVLGQNRGIILS